MTKITLRVPGTSANVGPGFDSVGFAVSMYNTLSFELAGEGLMISGCPEQYCNADNLAFLGFRETARAAGKPLPSGLKIRIETGIPVSRGLGSSAALITAGAFAANELLSCNFSRERLAEICTGIEGHPDNIVPALLGGLTASYQSGDSVTTVKYKIHDCFRFTALIPDFELQTSKARSALPDTIPFRDAVFNISRAAVLYQAFETGNYAAVSSALDDRLHQNYRKHLIPDYEQVRLAATECGAIGFCISGAGPTLMCVSLKDISAALNDRLMAVCRESWQVIPVAIENNGITII